MVWALMGRVEGETMCSVFVMEVDSGDDLEKEADADEDGRGE